MPLCELTVPTRQSILPPILRLRVLNRLPLHVAGIVSATPLQRLDVIDKLPGQAPEVFYRVRKNPMEKCRLMAVGWRAHG